jgi:hypothetical protein
MKRLIFVILLILTILPTFVTVNYVEAAFQPTEEYTNTNDLVQPKNTTITAESGSAADIQAAANTVYAAGGGTVYIPEGDFNLGGSVLIRDRVSLIGTGKDKTILRTQGISQVISAEGDNIRISGFSLINSDNYGGDGIQIGSLGVSCVDFRVDHLYIEGYYHAGVYVLGVDTRGVIDHCGIKVSTLGKASGLGYGVCVVRDEYWGDMELGSPNATFIEDCTFINARHAVASNGGAHYVFRYNLCQDGVINHQADAHGSNGVTEGTRAVEIYNNTFENPITWDDSGVGIRGGGGVIFNNTVHDYAYVVILYAEVPEGDYPLYHQINDLWIWDNTSDHGQVLVASSPDARPYVQVNRDYFLSAKPGYTPYQYPHPLTLGGDNNPPTILTSPIGGEVWDYNTSQNVTWHTTGFASSDKVKIEISRNSGANWAVLYASVANTGSSTWKVTGPGSPNCLIKVSLVGSPTISGVSSNDFTIKPPTITLTSPIGRETWDYNTSQNITWHTTGWTSSDKVKIENSRNGGANWTVLYASVANTGSKTWKVIGPSSPNCLIRVSLTTDPTVNDISDSSFTINDPAITVTSPNSSSNWIVNTTYTITWTSTGLTSSSRVKIEVSYDGGSTWTTIFANVANTGSKTWKVVGSPTTTAKIRITNLTYPSIHGDSGVFEITT